MENLNLKKTNPKITRKEINSVLGFIKSFKSGDKDYLKYNSSCRDFAELTGIDLFAKQYRNHLNLNNQNFLELIEKEFLVFNTCIFLENMDCIASKKVIKIGKKIVENFNDYFLIKINHFNDELVNLNPELKAVTRNKSCYSTESDFLCGVLYQRNPDDIDFYLKTRNLSGYKKNDMLDKLDKSSKQSEVIEKTNQILWPLSSLLISLIKAKKDVNFIPQNIHMGWILSPKTIIKALKVLDNEYAFINQKNFSIGRLLKNHFDDTSLNLNDSLFDASLKFKGFRVLK